MPQRRYMRVVISFPHIFAFMWPGQWGWKATCLSICVIVSSLSIHLLPFNIHSSFLAYSVSEGSQSLLSRGTFGIITQCLCGDTSAAAPVPRPAAAARSSCSGGSSAVVLPGGGGEAPPVPSLFLPAGGGGGASVRCGVCSWSVCVAAPPLAGKHVSGVCGRWAGVVL